MDKEIKETFEGIFGSIKRLEERMSRIEGAQTGRGTAAAPGVSKKQSIKEFLLELTPGDGVQLTLAIGYYLETCQGLPSFNKDDLEKGFRAAKETVPLNINDKVNMNIKRGHLMEAEQKKDNMKAWVITRSGEQYVKSKFKNDVGK